METKQSNNSVTTTDAVKIANQRALFSLEWENDTVFKKRELNYKTKAAFQKDLEAGKISKYTTVFIKDSKEIYKNGQYYGAGSSSVVDITNEYFSLISGYSSENYNKLLGYANSGVITYINDTDRIEAHFVSLSNMYEKLVMSSIVTDYNGTPVLQCYVVDPTIGVVSNEGMYFASKNMIGSATLGLYNKAQSYTPISSGDNLSNAIGKLEANVGKIVTNGDGTKFLSDNGTYKEVSDTIINIGSLDNTTGTLSGITYNEIVDCIKRNGSIKVRANIDNNDFISTPTSCLYSEASNEVMISIDASSMTSNLYTYTLTLIISNENSYVISLVSKGIIGDTSKDNSDIGIAFAYAGAGIDSNGVNTEITLKKTGDGTKFLSDNGTYKEISSSQTSIQDAPDSNYYVRKKGEWARINIPEIQQDIAFFDISYSGYLPADGDSQELTSDQFEKIKQAVIDGKIIRINAICGIFFGFANTYYSSITATKYIHVCIRSLEDLSADSTILNKDSKVDLSDFSVNINTTQNEDGAYTFTIRKSDYKIPEAPKDGRAYLRKNGKWVDPVTNIIKIHQSKGTVTGDINGPVIQWIRKNSHRVLAKNITNEGDLTPKMAYIELDDTNSNKYYDGTDAKTDGTEGDVFVKLPTFYYSGATLNGNDGTEGDILEIKFSREYFDGCVEWNTNLLIGAYAYVRNNDKIIRSVSSNSKYNNMLSVSELYNLMISGCGRQKQGFFGITWNIRSIINCLFYAMYGTMDFISKCGKGVSYTSVGQIGAGSSNILGMKDTTPEDIVGKTSVNFWGFEDWCGNYFELFSDVWKYKKINDTNHEITLHPINMYFSGYGEEIKFNINGNLNADFTYIKNTKINKYLNLFPTEFEEAVVGAFKSRIGIKQPNEDGQIFVYKGVLHNSKYTDFDYQLFSFGAYDSNDIGIRFSTRLIFIGDCIRYQNSNTFKEIPLEI